MHAQWTDTNQNFHHFMYRNGFFAAVDVVHLLQVCKICINFYLAGSGSFYHSAFSYMFPSLISCEVLCYTSY